MYKKDEISVILPIYNVAPYLARCLDSIITNTYEKLEIICVNDGSTDNTAEILAKYEEKDSRIIVFHKPNGGLSSARNAGIKIATGEYIAYVDPDDWVHERYFELLLNSIKKYNADISICNYFVTPTQIPFPAFKQISEREISSAEMITHYVTKNYVWRRLYKHSVIENIQFDETAKIEDYLYNMALIVYGTRELKYVFIDVPLYAYYKRDQSLVSKLDENDSFIITERLMEYFYEIKTHKIKQILADEIVSISLSLRHAFRILKDNKKVQCCNQNIKKCLPDMIKHRQVYRLFYFSPFLYRQFRIRKDMGFLKYEENLKKVKTS